MWSVAVYKRYHSRDISVVNAHSVAVLPVCYLLSRRLRAKLIYDTHELETETSTSVGVQRKIFQIIERSLISKCDAVFVVNQSIAEWYAKQYPGLRPVVIRNISSTEIAGPPVDIRKLLSIPEGKRLFIFVGNLTEGRHIPLILNAFTSPSIDAHVAFLGDGQLEPLVREYCSKHSNIHWLPPVPPTEVVSHIATCDAGFCLAQMSVLSYKLALPNKAFEYTKAGVPFFFTDLPEVGRLLGPAFSSWRIENPACDLMRAIANLTDSHILEAKAKMANLRLPTWDEEAQGMMGAYLGLASPTASARGYKGEARPS